MVDWGVFSTWNPDPTGTGNTLIIEFRGKAATVSYTHLDVYKRQRWGGENRFADFGTEIPAVSKRIRHLFQSGELKNFPAGVSYHKAPLRFGSSSAGSGSAVLPPVSYTHLRMLFCLLRAGGRIRVPFVWNRAMDSAMWAMPN